MDAFKMPCEATKALFSPHYSGVEHTLFRVFQAENGKFSPHRAFKYLSKAGGWCIMP